MLYGGRFGRAATWGLLGSFDGTVENDFTFPNGSVVLAVARSISWWEALASWGESYRVQTADYAQTFGPDVCSRVRRLGAVDSEPHSDASRVRRDQSIDVPVQPLATPSVDRTAREACGIASTGDPYADVASGNCYYDVVVTGDVKLAVAGLAVARAAEVFNAGVSLAPMFEDSSVNYTVRLDADFSFIFTARPPAAAGAGASVAYAVRAAPAGITIDPATGILEGVAGCVAGFGYSAGPPAVLSTNRSQFLSYTPLTTYFLFTPPPQQLPHL